MHKYIRVCSLKVLMFKMRAFPSHILSMAIFTCKFGQGLKARKKKNIYLHNEVYFSV